MKTKAIEKGLKAASRMFTCLSNGMRPMDSQMQLWLADLRAADDELRQIAIAAPYEPVERDPASAKGILAPDAEGPPTGLYRAKAIIDAAQGDEPDSVMFVSGQG